MLSEANSISLRLGSVFPTIDTTINMLKSNWSIETEPEVYISWKKHKEWTNTNFIFYLRNCQEK
jgi:hypothetical protein